MVDDFKRRFAVTAAEGGGAFVPLLGMRLGNYDRGGNPVEETEGRRKVVLGVRRGFQIGLFGFALQG